MEAALLRQSGGHPFLLQGLLGYLWDLRGESGAERVAARRLVKDRQAIFRTWSESLGSDGRALYAALLAAPSVRASRPALRATLKGSDLDEALDVLSFHGLVTDGLPDQQVQVAGELFRDWYRERHEEPLPADPPPANERDAPAARTGTDVFVVHGRNLKIRSAVFELLRALGLTPLEWSDMVERTGAAAPSILEVIQAGFDRITAVVVIFTADDEARPREKYQLDPEEGILQAQPRPNVLFEAGMAMALLPKKTVFVKVGKMRLLSDLGGLHMVEMDGSFEKRKELARRLRTAGCAIRDDTTTWHSAGDFSP